MADKGVSFFRQVAPTEVRLEAGEARLLFTLHAAAAMEAELGGDYLSIIYEAMELSPDGMTASGPMPLKRQAALVAILMRECGQDVTADDLMTLPMRDFTLLSQAALRELLDKSPRSERKKKDSRGT